MINHKEKLPLPKHPDQEMQSVSSADERSGGEYVEPNDPESDNKPILFSQKALNNLCRDLYLTKDKNVFLASRLQERNLLFAMLYSVRNIMQYIIKNVVHGTGKLCLIWRNKGRNQN
ncbi:Hypothetical predicted protein [Octopus vulgaris]|uniref:Uncharacterized protein n=1 Tax=Octopus vulgaris TaxID=6645 RepID=A0AA36FG26_OCTVU|nr:Hypothetical predicted protein [Octopus vulgaris]